MQNEKFIGLYQRYLEDTPELKETLSILGINKDQYQCFLSAILQKKNKNLSNY